MLSRLLNDPPLAFAFLLCAATILGGIVTFVQMFIEARRTRLTTAAEIAESMAESRKEAHTAERRANLKVLQRRERRERESA